MPLCGLGNAQEELRISWPGLIDGVCFWADHARASLRSTHDIPQLLAGAMKLPGEFFLWGTEQTFRGVFTLGVGGPAHHIFPQTPLGVTAALIETRHGRRQKRPTYQLQRCA